MRLSYTGLEEFWGCPHRFFLRYVQGCPELSGDPAETGKGFHSFAEKSNGSIDEVFLLQVLEREAALLEPPAAEDLRALTVRYLGRGGFPSVPSDAIKLERERRIAVTLDGEVVPWEDPRAGFRGVLDMTWLENGGTLGVVRDWKTKRVISPPGEQLRLYAWLLACLEESVEEVVVEQHFVRYRGAVKKATHVAEELVETVPLFLKAISEELDRRLAANDWKPRVSDRCRTCSFFRLCPKFKDKPAGFTRIETLEEAKTAADALVLLKSAASDTEKALRRWVLAHGGIPLEGEVLDFHPSEKRSVPSAKLLADELVARGLDEGALWDLLSLGAGDFDQAVKLLTADAPRGQKTKAREALAEEIKAKGLVVVKPETEFSRREVGAEEPCEA